MANCIFRIADTECRHPVHFGSTTDARCATCSGYAGRPRGVGDVVHTVARATGIAAVANRISGGDCGGCAARRAALNSALPFADSNNRKQE